MTELNFGLRIRQLIKQRKMTIQDAADKMGYSRQGFTDVIDKEDVNTAILRKVCEVFEIDLDYFLGDSSFSVRQKGNANVAGHGNTYSGNNNTSGNEAARIELLESENQHLKKQIQLLEQMVEVLRTKN